MTEAKVLQKITAHKRAVQIILNSCTEYEEFVKKEVPFEYWTQFGLGIFSGNNQIEWHIKLKENKYIPLRSKDLGASKYLFGDFNAHYYAVNSAELVAWAKDLPTMVELALELVAEHTALAHSIKVKL